MRQSDSGKTGEGARLAECPCGNDGVWYRTQPAGEMRRGPSLGNINGDDITDNLCDACFIVMITGDQRVSWDRIEPGERWADQSSRFEAYEDQSLPDDSW